MTDHLEFILLNRQPEIARLQDELEKFATHHQLPKRAWHEVQLALEEQLTNVVRYAYSDDREHRIKVRVTFRPPELRIEVEDDGCPFNPLQHPTPDLSQPIEQRPIGGLGIHMIRNTLDKVDYRRENERNILTMIKRI